MPENSPKNILIIKLESEKDLKNKTKSKKSVLSWVAGSSLGLRILLKLLRIFGYRLMTIEQAMDADKGRFVCLSLDGSSRQSLKAMIDRLQSLKIPATLFVPTSRISSGENADGYVISWSEIKLLKSIGWEIGALSHTYERLTEQSEQGQREQITSAQARLVDQIGKESVSFAYPLGAYDSLSVQLVKKHGFKFGIGLDQGLNRSEEMNPMQLQRISFDPEKLTSTFPVIKTVMAKAPSFSADRSHA